MKLDQPFSLSAVLGAETSPAEDENHGMLSLQPRKLSAFRRVVRKLIVGEHGPWNNVRLHRKSSIVGFASPNFGSIVSDREMSAVARLANFTLSERHGT